MQRSVWVPNRLEEPVGHGASNGPIGLKCGNSRDEIQQRAGKRKTGKDASRTCSALERQRARFARLNGSKHA